MEIGEYVADKIGYRTEEKELNVEENATMVSQATRDCRMCSHKAALADFRMTFTGEPVDFVKKAKELYKGCCECDCPVYKLAEKYAKESGIHPCDRCLMYIGNIRGRYKMPLCNKSLVDHK